MRFSLKHLMFVVAMAAIAMWSITKGIARTRHNMEVNQSTYAARLVAHMCVQHMKANSHTWPRNWGELRDDFGPCLKQSGESWTFDELTKRVDVDWDLNPMEFPPNDHGRPVVWVASDPTAKFHGSHPNEIVSAYVAKALAARQ